MTQIPEVSNKQASSNISITMYNSFCALWAQLSRVHTEHSGRRKCSESGSAAARSAERALSAPIALGPIFAASAAESVTADQ